LETLEVETVSIVGANRSVMHLRPLIDCWLLNESSASFVIFLIMLSLLKAKESTLKLKMMKNSNVNYLTIPY
jgi:hypothetical protein